MEKIQETAVRMHLAWLRFKTDERGAQTLEWLALALLILGILGAVSQLDGESAFTKALRDKFTSMVNKIDTK